MFQMRRDDDISDDEEDAFEKNVIRERREATSRDSTRGRRIRVSTQNDKVLMIRLSINTC